MKRKRVKRDPGGSCVVHGHAPLKTAGVERSTKSAPSDELRVLELRSHARLMVTSPGTVHSFQINRVPMHVSSRATVV
ncbi:hypothetical protein DPEC_G00202640 [Dallia pectoralis]|uniref:Uncharacterized protein n=1 Tax=Dallia pectoralis TaxID=75939 RepID=A0ACC2G9B6_DALPE|nr:hypothetical protein DPEC_G00202640 [Dallia pectoralis]